MDSWTQHQVTWGMVDMAHCDTAMSIDGYHRLTSSHMIYRSNNGSCLLHASHIILIYSHSHSNRLVRSEKIYLWVASTQMQKFLSTYMGTEQTYSFSNVTWLTAAFMTNVHTCMNTTVPQLTAWLLATQFCLFTTFHSLIWFATLTTCWQKGITRWTWSRVTESEREYGKINVTICFLA